MEKSFYVQYAFFISLMTSNIVKPKGAKVPELPPRVYSS